MNILKKLGFSVASAGAVIGLAIAPAAAVATQGVTAKATTSATKDATKLKLVITRGDSEISRRLSTLNTLSNKISGAPKLSADDKASLSSEVSYEVSNLTALKSKLDADTDVPAAQADAKSIITDYRVYALIVPKVNLIRTADDQQATQDKLMALATKLGSRVTSSSPASLKAALADMNAKLAAASGLSSSVQTAVLGLTPSDYNSDHGLLTSDRNQLKTAQNDNQAAVNDAKTIVNGLKNQ